MSKDIDELNEGLKSLESRMTGLTKEISDIQQTEKIRMMLKDQDKGTFKYLLDTLKVIAAIIFLLTAGNKAIDGNAWIKALVE